MEAYPKIVGLIAMEMAGSIVEKIMQCNSCRFCNPIHSRYGLRQDQRDSGA